MALPFRTFRRFILTAAPVTFWLAGSAIFIQDNVFEMTVVTGSSMTPTLSPEYDSTGHRDWLLWKKWNATRNIKRGDVILFRSPSRPEDCAVKRVIAVEGDTVLLDPRRRRHREREGEGVLESRGWDALRGKVEQVPEGHVWVEGDNWRKTWDSNAYGPISKSLIIGRAVAVVLPWDRMMTKPWEEYQSRTKVVPGVLKRDRHGDVEGSVDAIRHG